jgi:outer membrane protein TolC
MRPVVSTLFVMPLAASLLCAAPAAALDLSHPLTLNECLRIALDRNPSVLGARAAVRSGTAGVSGALAPLVPHLGTFSMGYSRDYYGPRQRTVIFNGIQFPGESPGYTGPPQFYMQLGLTTELLSLYRWKDLDRARIVEGATRIEEQDARSTVALATVEDYYGLVGAEKRLDVAIEAAGNARERQGRARAFYEVGNVSRGDVSKATRDLAQAELDSIAAENSVSVARARLAATMGLDPTTTLRVVSDLESPISSGSTGSSELAQAGAATVPDLSATRENTAPARRIIENRPDIRALRARAEAADAQRASTAASLLPSLSASLYNRWDANDFPGSAPLSRNYSWSLSFDLSVPILDWQANHARVIEAEALAEESRYTLESRRQTASQELVSARLAVREASARLEVAKKGLLAAEDDYAFSRERFRVGAGTSLELSDAQLGLSRARLSYIDAQVQARLAEAQLAHAEGREIAPGVESGGEVK